MARTPTTRILGLLELLQTRTRIAGSELARRLEVDTRTVRRYLDQLEQLGIPIVAERGRDGGCGLVAGFRLPPMMFNNDEALALALGLLAVRSLGLAESAPAVESARAKLERVLPAELRRRLAAIDANVQIDSGHPASLADNQFLATLSAAAQARQVVRLDYRSAVGESSTREFDPYGVAFRGGRWYAVGYCHLRHGQRAFRLDRIVEVLALPRSFGRPEHFDTLAALSLALATLPRLHSVRVRLHTGLAEARSCLFAAIGVYLDAGDSVMLQAEVDDLDWLARELARCPFRFTIEHPPALREALAQHAQNLLRSHAP